MKLIALERVKVEPLFFHHLSIDQIQEVMDLMEIGEPVKDINGSQNVILKDYHPHDYGR
jgi:hypothetical protein